MQTDQHAHLPTLLTKADVCQELRINERTLERWISAGQWPAADVARGAKFRRWTKTRFIEGVAQLAQQEAAR